MVWEPGRAAVTEARRPRHEPEDNREGNHDGGDSDGVAPGQSRTGTGLARTSTGRTCRRGRDGDTLLAGHVPPSTRRVPLEQSGKSNQPARARRWARRWTLRTAAALALLAATALGLYG